MPLSKLTITKLVHGGNGLAFDNGKAVFIPYSIPGEEVEVSLAGKKKDHAQGGIQSILKPSPHRVAPECPYFGKCGGCQFQHIEYSRQIEYKKEILLDCFKRIGKIDWKEPVNAIASDPWEYRNRVTWQQDPDYFSRIGFHAKGSNKVIPVEKCPLLHPALNKFREKLKKLDQCFPGGIEAVTDNDGNISSRNFPTGTGLKIAVNKKDFTFSHRVFFQTNRMLIEDLVRTAVGSTEGDQAVDLYAGSGLFSAFLADRFKKVIAVERNPNCRNVFYKSDNIMLHTTDVATWLREQGKELKPIDLVLIDPPRMGLSPEERAGLLNLKPARITYVSCDPATLSRDASAMLQSGYEIKRVDLLDMFPQTCHIETIVKFERH